MKKIRHYTEEFKQDAVHLALTSEQSIDATARDLEIPSGTLYGWIDKQRKKKTQSPLTADTLNQKFLDMKKEIAQLREERDILKKAAAFFAKHQR